MVAMMMIYLRKALAHVFLCGFTKIKAKSTAQKDECISATTIHHYQRAI
jgi:hypothetical protein